MGNTLTKVFSATTDKLEVFQEVRAYLEGQGFTLTKVDDSRPWGGFFYVSETQAEKFISAYFPNLSMDDFKGYNKLSPKILLVAPQKRLSWQYHHRRSEIWKVIGGNAGVVVSETEEETPMHQLDIGTEISLRQGQCHRLIGLKEWGILAEIWQHTDPENPSDEEDIVRVQDDFGR
ncbi:MAG: phosphoheptose isomerase [Balneolales bacterium]